MSGDWVATKWGDIATLAYGKALSGYSDTMGSARVYGTNGPIGWHDEALWDGPGVIVGRKGAYRGVHYTADPYWVIDTAYSLRPKVDLNLRWAYYQLKYLDVNNLDDGSPIPSTTRDAFYVQDLLLPPREVQDRIARLLSSLDDKIELNRRMAATLDEMARSLFKSWFVDFDPVRAKVECRDPGLPAATAALFPDQFGKDGLPAGWLTGTLADVARLNPESRGSASESHITYVDLANTKWGAIEETQYFASDDAPSRAKRVLRSGDTIVGTVRPGNGSFALVATDGLIGSTGFAVLRPKAYFLREFVYLAATSGENIAALAAFADGGAYPAVRPDLVAETPCCLPHTAVLEAFHAVTVGIIDRIAAARSQSAELGAVRDTLLPKLISGELRIKDAGKSVEAA